MLEKHVPVAAGLGGGSSDAAAVLRGLNYLWELAQPEMNLIEIAGEIGSDPPFFVVGGTASRARTRRRRRTRCPTPSPAPAAGDAAARRARREDGAHVRRAVAR